MWLSNHDEVNGNNYRDTGIGTMCRTSTNPIHIRVKVEGSGSFVGSLFSLSFLSLSFSKQHASLGFMLSEYMRTNGSVTQVFSGL